MFINFPKYKLRRNVGLFMLCIIGIDGTIGGGIFVLLSHGAEAAGQWLPLSFLLGGALAFLAALLYAELATTMPLAGADLELVFNATKRKYFPFIFSWLVLLGDIGYLTINALGLAFYANFFITVNPLVIAFTALFVAVAINLRGVEKTGRGEIVTGMSLLALLGIYVILVVSAPGFSFAPGEFVAQMPLHALPIIAGTALIFTTFAGFEYVASIAGEVKDPSRNIPLALMITVAVSTAIFVLVAWATVNVVSVTELASSDAPFLLIAKQLGNVGYFVVIPAALIATAGSLLAAVMVSSRRLYALSEQGYFNGFFSRINGSRVPYRSVLLVAGLAILMMMTGSVAFVAYTSNTVYLLGLIIISVSLMKLRSQRPYLARPFRVPLFPYIPLAVIALAVTVLLFIGPRSLVATLLWALTGYLVYLVTRIKQRQLYLATWGGMLFLLLVGLVGVLLLL